MDESNTRFAAATTSPILQLNKSAYSMKTHQPSVEIIHGGSFVVPDGVNRLTRLLLEEHMKRPASVVDVGGIGVHVDWTDSITGWKE